MITGDNLTAYFDELDEKQILDAMGGPTDQVACWFNGYGVAFIGPFDYVLDDEDEILSTGGFIADKDELLRLFEESDSINPFLIELI